MNRRSFFHTLLAGTAGALFLPKLPDRYRWKGPLIVPNPAYISAPYEIAFYYVEGPGYQPINIGPPPTYKADALRFSLDDLIFKNENPT